MARLDYANARIGARRALLIGATGMREVLSRPSLEGRVAFLRERPAGAALPESFGADPLGELEAALREGWRREAFLLLEAAEGGRARALLRAFLGLDEAAAVKAVIRGVAHGMAVDRTVAAALAPPPLDEEGVRAAAAAPDVAAAIEMLAAAGSELAAPVRAAIPLRGEQGLLPLELAADRAAFERARRACAGVGEDRSLLARHLEERIDARNAATLLALAGTAPAADGWVEGGRRLGEGAFRRLAGGDPKEVAAALEGIFPEAGPAFAAPWSAERALERALLAPLRREARRRPLSLAVPVAYLAERRDEVRRVSIVLRGSALSLPGDEILELVEA